MSLFVFGAALYNTVVYCVLLYCIMLVRGSLAHQSPLSSSLAGPQSALPSQTAETSDLTRPEQ